MQDSPIKILLVEDNPGDARLLREMLAEAASVQFVLTHVERWHAALERLQQERFDAVLLDLMLPDSGGIETFATLHHLAPRVPIVVLTSLNDETLALQAVRDGAQDYLVKGQVNSNLLRRALRYAIERQRIEEALRSANEFIDRVMEATTNAIVALNIEGKFTLVNPRAAEISGYAPNDLVGLPFYVLVPPDHLARVREQIHQVLVRGERLSQFEMPVLRKDDAQRWIRLNLVPMFLRGKITGLVGTAEVISAPSNIVGSKIQN
ncbi:MAG: response regulator [Chloroflexi bacterium]|nr:response regulator [Chloroflexota bacterium]